MPKNKIVNIGGTKYMVRGLTFEELVKLSLANAEEKESKAVVAEVLSKCLIEPKINHGQITHLPDKTLIILVLEVLDIAKCGMMDMCLVPMPSDKGPPRDMIAQP